MPAIPQFQQQKLASSLVGTPGVDTSVQSLAKTIGSEADQTTNQLLNVQQSLFIQQKREEAELAKEQRVLTRETKKRRDAVSKATKVAELGVYNQQVQKEILQDRTIKSDQKAKLWRKRMEARIQADVESFGDDLLGQEYRATAITDGGDWEKSFNSEIESLKTSEALSDFNISRRNSINSFSESPFATEESEPIERMVGRAIGGVEGKSKSYLDAFPGTARDVMDKDIKDSISNGITGKALKHPEEILTPGALDKPLLKQMFDEKEIEAFKRTARTQKDRMQEKEDHDRAQRVVQVLGEAKVKHAEGQFTEQDAAALEEQGLVEGWDEGEMASIYTLQAQVAAKAKVTEKAQTATQAKTAKEKAKKEFSELRLSVMAKAEKTYFHKNKTGTKFVVNEETTVQDLRKLSAEVARLWVMDENVTPKDFKTYTAYLDRIDTGIRAKKKGILGFGGNGQERLIAQEDVDNYGKIAEVWRTDSQIGREGATWAFQQYRKFVDKARQDGTSVEDFMVKLRLAAIAHKNTLDAQKKAGVIQQIEKDAAEFKPQGGQ